MTADTAAVLVAAGQGRRMGGVNKALMRLAGRPVLEYSLHTLRKSPSIGRIILVMNDFDVQRLADEWHTDPASLGVDQVVAGGEERWLSSKNGCWAAGSDLPYLLVHDAARPLLQAEDLEAVLRAARKTGAALAAEPLSDTLKQSCADTRVQSTVPREGLWRAQTPQVAKTEWMRQAFSSWDTAADGLPTDESMMLENIGHPPELVPCQGPNFKITLPRDLLLAEALLRNSMALDFGS
ncbi:MAG: 2-C-methyl-D-erythritol 4-phosphate cytidylyltransferase [Planctomycetota bacterium]|nr:2-C-methyl-D-erythritol 4-phosphate cytidylyltransferase [Planctomycetota bacterium]MDA1114335.1 2-C-methyl-D-erythritol 4-phosphate cytidylyltransferase [Planctomycetota bacterium]